MELYLLIINSTEFRLQSKYIKLKQRNEIKVLFDSYKNVFDVDKTFMQGRRVLEGWLMANFIAMMAYYKLYSLLSEADLIHKYSPKDIIEISKSIYKLKIRGEWNRSEMAVKTMELFKKIKIDYSLN